MKIELILRRSLLLALLFCLAASITIRTDGALDPDLGWHLMTGKWIIQHGTVPTTDPFSIDGYEKPWVAYSWLFEIIIYWLYDTCGMMGIILLNTLLTIAITCAIISTIQRINESPTVIVGLTGLNLIALSALLGQPRPWLFSILLFTLTINQLVRAQETNYYKHLWRLPIIFILWANLHIQFIYGIFVLCAYLTQEAIVLLTDITKRRKIKIGNKINTILIVLFTCIAATLVTPYGIGIYSTLAEIIKQTGVYDYVSEMKSLSFRRLSDWVVLFLALLSAASIGRGRKGSIFISIVFFTGIYLAFRSQREVWMLAIPASILIAYRLSNQQSSKEPLFTAPVSIITILLFFGYSYFLTNTKSINNENLAKELDKAYPASSVYVAKLKNLQGPLFNDYNWGGFLIWKLSNIPVSIDGRANLYGDEPIRKSLGTWAGDRNWYENNELKESQIVIAKQDEPLTAILKLDPRFSLTYEDSVSALFVKNK